MCSPWMDGPWVFGLRSLGSITLQFGVQGLGMRLLGRNNSNSRKKNSSSSNKNIDKK